MSGKQHFQNQPLHSHSRRDPHCDHGTECGGTRSVGWGCLWWYGGWYGPERVCSYPHETLPGHEATGIMPQAHHSAAAAWLCNTLLFCHLCWFKAAWKLWTHWKDGTFQAILFMWYSMCCMREYVRQNKVRVLLQGVSSLDSQSWSQSANFCVGFPLILSTV